MNRYKYGSINGDRERSLTPYCYTPRSSTPSSSRSSTPKTFRSTTNSANRFSDVKKDNNRQGMNIRSGMRHQSKYGCFRLFQCAVVFYESKIVTIEPVMYVVMFAIFLHKIMFELYTFNWYAKDKFNPNNETRFVPLNMCLDTSLLNNRTWMMMFNLSSSTSNYTGDIVETETGMLNLMVGVISGTLSIGVSLFLGPLSDRFGRKPILIIVILGMIIHAAGSMVIIKFNANPYYFIPAAAARGATGGIAGIYAISYSYIADVSSRKWLTVRLGFLEALTFMAISSSLMTGGVLIDYQNCYFEAIAIAIVVCLVCALCYISFATPESYDRERFAATIIKNNKKSMSTVKKKSKGVLTGPKTLLRGFQIFFGRKYSRCKIWTSFIVMFVTIINSTGVITIITLFLLHEPLHWHPQKIGIYLGITELARGLGLVVLLPLLVYTGVADSMIVIISMLLTISMNVCLAFVGMSWQVFLVGIVQVFEALITPGLKAMISKAVAPEDQGAVFSFISAVQAFASVLAYLLYIPVYTHTLKFTRRGYKHMHASGISFLIMAGAYLCIVPLFCSMMLWQKYESSRETQTRSRLIASPETSTTTSAHVQVPPQTVITKSLEASIGKDALERSYQSISGHHSYNQ